MITPEFFDLELYAIYKAIFELIGERAWDVVWRSGEFVVNELWEKLELEEADIFEGLKKLASFLSSSGYVKEIRVEKKGQDLAEYVMYEPVIAEGAKRLIEDGMVPPHVSTSLMFALLKKKGYRAEMIGEPEFLKDGRVVERWKLIRVQEEVKRS
ncbi:MAG TPA: hypothetical protein EYP68_01805 [Candidatus Korarchaeota archaeon]|nr:hypothetical protein [Candidatus Korarchaeota archaeon]